MDRLVLESAFVQIEGEDMMHTRDFVVSTEGLAKSLDDVPALHSLDLHVPSGSIFPFPAPNGAGKPTTIKLLGSPARTNPREALACSALHNSIDQGRDNEYER